MRKGYVGFVVEILHQTTTPAHGYYAPLLLYLIEILHQTTTIGTGYFELYGCILLKFYIKPQPKQHISCKSFLLYLIEILHQTTTLRQEPRSVLALYLIEILHQTTTISSTCTISTGCILLKFYIKPQPYAAGYSRSIVVSYWNSTSNHNTRAWSSTRAVVVSYWNSTSNHNLLIQNNMKIELYLIEILHQTTTLNASSIVKRSCILLKFYIKPQRPFCSPSSETVVSYWNSTSNHNFPAPYSPDLLLYLIEILHQTTTPIAYTHGFLGCILLKFYIKPQHEAQTQEPQKVVSYWNSTSNHNNARPISVDECVVSYWNSTSNHNKSIRLFLARTVVSYWNSTSNHNSDACNNRHPFVVSYWNSTSNHNTRGGIFRSVRSCILLKFYIKPQLWSSDVFSSSRCILLKFYIKPQPVPILNKRSSELYLIEILHQTTTSIISCLFLLSCILLKFYIKPQRCHGCRVSTSVVSYWNSTSNHNEDRLMCECPQVVSYWNSTSNHNPWWRNCRDCELYLIEILHQTTTHQQLFDFRHTVVSYWNSTSNHNEDRLMCECPQVVSYWNSTSNHNWATEENKKSSLYLIEILHQTTTLSEAEKMNVMLYLIEILHQTTTLLLVLLSLTGVVSYWNSTSNHNRQSSSTTSPSLYLIEILHQTTTYPSELCTSVWLYLIEILHQTTTQRAVRVFERWLYLIEILHQTTTVEPALSWR